MDGWIDIYITPPPPLLYFSGDRSAQQDVHCPHQRGHVVSDNEY